MENWQEVNQSEFDKIIVRHKAICTDDLGSGRFANYYDSEYKLIARIDQSHTTYEILENS